MKIEFVGTTLSIDNISNKEIKFSLIPNPTSDSFTVHFDKNLNLSTLNIQIIDLQGRFVSQQKNISNNTSISTNSFTNGIYFVKIQDENGKEITIKKLIIKH